MKKLGIITGIFVLVLLAYTFSKSEKVSDRGARAKVPELVVPARPSAAISQVAVQAAPSPSEKPAETPAFDEKFRHESEAIGQLDDKPKETEQRLREWARSLTPNDLHVLSQKALNPQLNGDDRFLAVQLLGWSESAGALPLLENIAATPITSREDRARSGELALRALAIESVGQVGPVSDRVTSLTRLSNKVSDTFLADRTQRALAHLNQLGVDAPDVQDTKALTKLTH